MEDIKKYLDVLDIQPYIMNRDPVVFLNKRPQKAPKKGYKYAYDICQRGIACRSKICSLGCKVIIGNHILFCHFCTNKKLGTPLLQKKIVSKTNERLARGSGLNHCQLGVGEAEEVGRVGENGT